MKKGVYGLFKLLNISYKDKMILKVLKIETWIGDATNCYIVQDEKIKRNNGNRPSRRCGQNNRNA